MKLFIGPIWRWIESTRPNEDALAYQEAERRWQTWLNRALALHDVAEVTWNVADDAAFDTVEANTSEIWGELMEDVTIWLPTDFDSAFTTADLLGEDVRIASAVPVLESLMAASDSDDSETRRALIDTFRRAIRFKLPITRIQGES